MPSSRYIVVAGGCLVQFTVIGFLFSFSIYFPEIEKELGWSRTLISLGLSLSTLAMGSFAILGGRLSDRLGPRRVMLASGVIYAFGIFLLSLMTAPWQYLLIYTMLLGVGLATHDVVTLSTVGKWFDKKRGLMTGVVKTGTAAGQVLVPPLAAVLIAWVGWRGGLMWFSVGALVLLVMAALMLRAPSEAEARAASSAPGGGLSYSEARKTRTFWTIAIVQVLFFPTMMTVPFHLGVHAQDLGRSPEQAALLLSVLGGASVAGRLVLGSAADRLGGKNAYLIALTGLFAALSLLPFVTTPVALTAVVALYGVGHGALFVIPSPTVARYFGMRAHGQIFGTVIFSGTLGGAVGPTLAGWIFDTWGSYTPAFLILAACALVAIVLVLTLPKPEPV